MEMIYVVIFILLFLLAIYLLGRKDGYNKGYNTAYKRATDEYEQVKELLLDENTRIVEDIESRWKRDYYR